MRALKLYLLYPVIILSIIVSASFVNASPIATAASTTSIPNTYKASSLTDIHRIVKSTMSKRGSDITIRYRGTTENLLNQISDEIDNIIRNDEYLNYSFRGVNMSYSAYGHDVTIKIHLKYYETLSQVNYVDKQVSSILAAIIKPDMNDHEKVKAVHDYVVRNLTYDITLENNSPYPALVEGTTACNGYAMLIYKMLQNLGIESRLISGVASSSAFDVQNHAWNMVKLDGAWYHLDATWNDPVPDQTGRVLYNYYLLTDKEISKDHSWTTGGINGQEKPYPLAQTTYVQQLQTLMNTTNKADRYQRLLNELGLNYLLPEYTASNLSELGQLIHNGFKDYQREFSIRYIGASNDLMADLKEVIHKNAPFSVMSWRYGYVHYPRGTTANDKLITISEVKYKQQPPQNVQAKIDYPITGYKSMGTFANVGIGKEWTVQFDRPIDFASISNDNVKVLDSEGEPLSTITYSLVDSSSLKVKNKNNYYPGETYYLLVTNTIKGTNGKPVKEKAAIKFTISNKQ